MSESVPIENRQEFQRTVGFALYTDVNNKLADTLARQYIPPLPSRVRLESTRFYGQAHHLAYDNPAGLCLYLTTNKIMQQIPKSGTSFYRQYNVTEEDKIQAKPFAFKYGFGDMDFPWHFSAGLANSVVDHFVDHGKLTPEQKNQFTLHDWANVIGTGWFSRIAHLMALAVNGTYGTFGTCPDEYTNGALENRLQSRLAVAFDNPLFEYKELLEPADGRIYATVTPSKTAIQGLRKRLKNDDKSIGCPVARYATLLDRKQVENNVHVQNLLANGTLRIVPERSNDNKVRVVQDESAIDKALSLFAMQLDRYASIHGTPHVTADGGRPKVTHQMRPPLDVLSWPASDEEKE